MQLSSLGTYAYYVGPLFLSLQRDAPTSYAMRMITMCVDAAAAAGVPGAELVQATPEAGAHCAMDLLNTVRNT